MRAPRDLAGLRVLVTGASGGIGSAVSQMLVDRGARVVGSGRNGAALAGVAALEAALARDLSEPGAPAALVADAVAALGGGLDVVVSSAGYGWHGPYGTITPEGLDDLLDVNLRAPMQLALAAAPYLRASAAGGQLVLVGSIAGLVGVAEEVAYGTAKAGLRGLADGLRAEWGRPRRGRRPPGAGAQGRSMMGLSARGGGPVTVTLVSPGPVDTAFFSRRNRPYQRSWPKPLPVGPVAAVVVGAIERRRQDVVVPRWLAIPARLNGGAPALYRLMQRAQDLLPS